MNKNARQRMEQTVPKNIKTNTPCNFTLIFHWHISFQQSAGFYEKAGDKLMSTLYVQFIFNMAM